MKKAFSYIVLGAISYACFDSYINSKGQFKKNIKKLKNMECVNKIKSML